MAKKRDMSRFEAAQIEKERLQQIQMSPLSAGERLRNQLALEVDRQLRRVGRAVGDHVDTALIAAMTAHRRWQAFSHDLSEASGKRIYEIRTSLASRLGSADLQRRLNALRGPGLPPAPLPKEAAEVLAAIRATRPPSKIFEGENEYQEMLRAKGLVEADPNRYYVSRTAKPSGPSLD